MKKQKQLYKLLSLLMVFSMVIGLGQVSFAATSIFKDTNRHWALNEINKGVNLGIVKGYDDGTFKPDQPVSRAEFSKMLNVALGVTKTASIYLSDIYTKDWYYSEVQKAVAAGYITGYTDNTFKPNNRITRQEAANMISKVLPEYGTTASLSGLSDNTSIASWAKEGVISVFARGYMKGDDKGMYRPEGSLTRAEACTILVRFIEGENIVSSNSVIDDKGITVSKKIYTNNLTIHKDVGSGDVDLNQIVVLGTLSILGGGENTVEISDSLIKKMEVAKTTGDVHVLLTGESLVEEATVKNGAIIEQKSLSGEGFKKLILDGSTLDSQTVSFKGNFPDITLKDRALVELTSGRITTLTIDSGAASSKVELLSGTAITTAVVGGKTEFLGTGKISTMKANVNGITYETKPTTITKGSGVTTLPVLSEDTGGPNISTITPKADTTNIAPDTKITIVFNEPIYLEGGGRVTSSNIDEIIELRKSTATGTKQDFTATISTDKKTLTITPEDILTTSTYYYVIVLDESIEDEDGNENDKITTRFKTGTQDLAAPSISFSPANGATNVAVNAKITINFSEAIRLAGGGTVTNSNISNFVELRVDSSTGTRKSYSATINSTKKTIELTPSETFTVGEDYYVIILSGKIEDSEGNDVSKTTSTFRTGLPVAATPTISTNPTTTTDIANNGVVIVTLATNTSGGSTYYTIDGSMPSASSTLYTTPFEVSNTLVAGQTITVKAITVKLEMTNSTIASKAITFRSNQVTTPTISLNPNNSSGTPSDDLVEITLSSTAGSTIYYTLDGTEPTTLSTEYVTPFNIDSPSPSGGTRIIKAIAVKSGMANSEIGSRTITFIDNTAKKPEITVVSSSATAFDVTLDTQTSGAKIYYTKDGTTPSASSIEYSGLFSVNISESVGGTVTINAVTIKTDMVNSDIETKIITFP